MKSLGSELLPEKTMSQVMTTYEARLGQDPRWAMSEGDRHFDEKSSVHDAMRRIGKRLSDLNIPYAIVGGMALFRHGFRRFTEDVDVLVERSDLKRIHDALIGLGYTPVFEGSKNIRDTQTGVRIEFLLSGGYPGDGKEKPVAFPSPSQVGELSDDLSFADLRTIVELKLASGMSGAGRLKDLGDVQELIKVLALSEEYADRLDEYVRPTYRQLWKSVRGENRCYKRLWKVGKSSAAIGTIDDLIVLGSTDRDLLIAMRDAGVTVEHASGKDASGVFLVTSDPDVAKKFDMHDESEYFEQD